MLHCDLPARFCPETSCSCIRNHSSWLACHHHALNQCCSQISVPFLNPLPQWPYSFNPDGWSPPFRWFLLACFFSPWPELLGFAKENNVPILIRHTSYSCYLIYLGNNMWNFFPVPKNSQEIHHISYFLITVLTTKFSCLHGWTHFYSTKNVKACGIA